MITKILVAVDTSERAAGVVAAAAELARGLGATLCPVRVLEVPPEFPPAARESHRDLLPGHLTEIALLEMQELFGGVGPVHVAPPTVKIGVPWRMIVLASEELDVDLIVVGSHGYHGLDHLLGTTAGRVANLAHRHVLVVHNRGASDDGGPSSAAFRGGSSK